MSDDTQARAFSIWQERQAQLVRWGPMAHVPPYTADGQASAELSADEIWRQAEESVKTSTR